jgi:hypothetical protein
MHLKKVFTYLAIIVLMTAMIGCGASSRIQIREVADSYELSVPLSKLVMNLPKGGFTRVNMNIGGGTSNPRYFYFNDNKRQIILSGWFEPEERFTGVKKQWEDKVNSMRKMGNPELSNPKNVVFEHVGKWDVVMYDIEFPAHMKAKQANVNAHWVQAETWVDLHLSAVSSAVSTTEAREMLTDVLNGISFSEKKE